TAGLLPVNPVDYSSSFSACYTSLSTAPSCVPITASSTVPYGSFVTLHASRSLFEHASFDFSLFVQFAPASGASPAYLPNRPYAPWGLSLPSGSAPIPVLGQLLANFTQLTRTGSAGITGGTQTSAIAPNTTFLITNTDPRQPYIGAGDPSDRWGDHATGLAQSGLDAVQWIVNIGSTEGDRVNSTSRGFAAGSFNLTYSDPDSAWGRAAPVPLFGWKEAVAADWAGEEPPSPGSGLPLSVILLITAASIMGALILVSCCFFNGRPRRRRPATGPAQSIVSKDSLAKEFP
ncbi:hypothetical protein HKX48_002066, partial [Thoreauomyces humboldtii]